MPNFIFVYFIYGLAFFSMGLVVAVEGGRASDARLRYALRPLAVFGVVHGGHEWLEMFQYLRSLPLQPVADLAWEAVLFALFAFSFLSLAAFGASLLSNTRQFRRFSLLVPVVLVSVWGFGLFALRRSFPPEAGLWAVAHVWTRYVLAIPAALLASIGLIAQQRTFRQAGLMRFGRDSLWAAVAFGWYGLVGQLFAQSTALPPSNVINEVLFLRLFGFPVQLLRAGAALAAAVFVMRFLHAFEVETQHKIAALQAERLEEAQRRDALRGQLLRRVVAAQESERQRVARELHDAIGQSLTALGLGLRGVAASLRSNADRAARDLRQLETLTTNALDELHHLIADLRPSHLDDLGLGATIRWYAKDVEARVGLEIEVEVTGEPRPMSPPIKIALFRIAQEAINNVIKHSSARHAWARLGFGTSEVSLQVEDDGVGFDTTRAAAARPTWGLLGMQERVALLGGCFQIDSAPGRGTRMQVVIPYEEVGEVEAAG